MKIDLHCHTKYSKDNVLEAENVLEQAIKIGRKIVKWSSYSTLQRAQIFDLDIRKSRNKP